ncbi:MAG: glutamate--tRNA ligase [Planctomycetes bacterium]|nr:glutamate--tRNA ligase [Planctomycetota bacterium]
MPSNIRVRFAPSPTGKLHVGGARTALFNWAYARRNGGKFLLRIEDTDEGRSTPEYERAILEGMHWLGIQWDEGPDIGGPCAPYRQTERAARHKELAQELFGRGWAYRCFCTADRLEKLREEQSKNHLKPEYDGLCRKLSKEEVERRVQSGEKYVLRFAVPAGETRFLDHVRGDVVFQNKEVDDWIMVRSDGTPTYNFVVVCDDIDMGITHVFRGEEHLVNTPKQVLLYQAFAKPIPEFGHLPLMLGTDGKKLSKRTGDTALQDYREKGYPKDAIINFLCLQGWALNGTTEVFSVDQLVSHFDVKDVSKAGAIFDIDKFQWLAGEYIRKEPHAEFAEHCLPFVVAAGLATEAEVRARWDWYLRVATGEQERVRTYGELPPRIAYLFGSDAEFKWDDDAAKNAKKHAAGAETLRAYDAWLDERLAAGKKPTELRDETKAWIAARGLKIPALFQPLRCALTGQAGGPDLFEIMELLGVEKVRARIRRGAERLAS